MRPHLHARCALATLCGTLALIAACSTEQPKHSTNMAAAGAAGSSTSAQVTPPSAGTGTGSNANAPQSANASDPAAPDAGDPWPHCDATFDDEDGGVSPYLDGCAIDERFGVFVNPNLGPDSDADGSRSHPFATLAHAVAAAVNSGKHVFACEGTYEEPLRIGTAISNGLHVFGGLSCETYLPVSNDARSRVHDTKDGAALIVADTRDVLIERFELEDAPNAMIKPGGNSVAAFISNSRHVLLRDVTLRASDGARGADGAAAPSEPAGNGMAGEDGGNACSARPNPGGGAVTSPTCRDQTGSASGSGGGGGEGTGPGGSGTWFGFPQFAGENTADWSCAQGVGGPFPPAAGNLPIEGSGGRGFGALLGTGFIGFGGQDGADGGPGQGGGGGGGAKAPASCSAGATAVGASGGGGGSGGCGGKGGEGGGAGGTSIGLLVVSAKVKLERVAISYGNGGDGGHGAPGQKGGKGAAGGKGGKGVSGSRNACDGAPGGDGGDGGDGGGGNGGHAFGVLFAGEAPQLVDVTGEAQADAHHGGMPGHSVNPVVTPGIGTAGETAFQFAF